MQIRIYDVMRFTTKMVKYWIKNIFGNIEVVFFKLGITIEKQITPIVVLP